MCSSRRSMEGASTGSRESQSAKVTASPRLEFPYACRAKLKFEVAGMNENTIPYKIGLSTRFGYSSLHAALVTTCRDILTEMVTHNLISQEKSNNGTLCLSWI
ncbi:uncharacterized protein AKAW2_50685A [Aspergillus luchuensis]|uniref:Uncharacterized protein n=1 Tax=Aspergillus kawachii TaxID=1069201 RepID=A0A7R7WD69_ASPKA|nr:uncharacterized protein AKAW2_50685A [Aspergillus luchuensis]BCS00344.1 hypothetical protein AKAW2_50685A [Aspergillus luchuensis]